MMISTTLNMMSVSNIVQLTLLSLAKARGQKLSELMHSDTASIPQSPFLLFSDLKAWGYLGTMYAPQND